MALEKDGFDLDLSRSASDYAWEADQAQAWAVFASWGFQHQAWACHGCQQVELYSWPTREEYMAPEDLSKSSVPQLEDDVREDKALEPIRTEAPQAFTVLEGLGAQCAESRGSVHLQHVGILICQ